MLDGMFTIVAAAVLGISGAISLKLAAMMIFGDRVEFRAALAISATSSLAAVASLALIDLGRVEGSTAVFMPGLVFAASSWLLGVLLAPYERTEGWRTHSKAFLITMAQCIGVTVVGAAVSSVLIVGTWAFAAFI